MQDSDAAAAGPRTLRRGIGRPGRLRDQGPDGLSVTDIARLTGIQRPTIYRLLAALLDAGLVLPVTGTKKYRAQLAVDPDTRSRDPRVRQLLPVLRRLADRTGDAVFLVVRDEDDSISLHREIGSYPCRSSPPTPASASRWAWIGRHGAPGRPARRGRARHRRAQFRPARRVRRHDAAGNVPIDREHPRARLFGGGQPRRARAGRAALLDAHGAPLLAVSVTAIIDRMPAQRQREIAGWIKTELARLAAQA